MGIDSKEKCWNLGRFGGMPQSSNFLPLEWQTRWIFHCQNICFFFAEACTDVGMTEFSANACPREWQWGVRFTIKWLRQVIAVCECTPNVSWVFGAEWKPKLLLKKTHPIMGQFLFHADSFLPPQKVSFTAMEMNFFKNNSHAWIVLVVSNSTINPQQS